MIAPLRTATGSRLRTLPWMLGAPLIAVALAGLALLWTFGGRDRPSKAPDTVASHDTALAREESSSRAERRYPLRKAHSRTQRPFSGADPRRIAPTIRNPGVGDSGSRTIGHSDRRAAAPCGTGGGARAHACAGRLRCQEQDRDGAAITGPSREDRQDPVRDPAMGRNHGRRQEARCESADQRAFGAGRSSSNRNSEQYIFGLHGRSRHQGRRQRLRSFIRSSSP